MFSYYCLRDTVLYFEQQQLYSQNVPLYEAIHPDGLENIKKRLWQLFALPHAYLSHEFTYWTKRLTRTLFGHYGPEWTTNQSYVEPDKFWYQTE